MKVGHPFERVHMRAEDAFEIGIARRCRELDAELGVRRRHASRQKEIERYCQQCDDCGVMRHGDILRCNDWTA